MSEDIIGLDVWMGPSFELFPTTITKEKKDEARKSEEREKEEDAEVKVSSKVTSSHPSSIVACNRYFQLLEKKE